MKKVLQPYWQVIETHTQLVFLAIIVGLLLGMVFFVGLDHRLWGDEVYFVTTIRYFGENFSLRTLADYDQVTGPLVYILYALWGKVLSFEIVHLRLLSLFFSVATFMLIFRLYGATLPSRKVALLAVCFLLLNPYMWGLSFFVFTDIPTLCFVVLIAWAVYRQQPLLLFLATVTALLSRQYAVYLVVAAGFYQIASIYRGKKSQILNLSALVLGCLPLLVLMFVWGGVAPPSGVKRWVVAEEQFYHYGYITTYITFMAVYLSPIMLMMWRELFRQRAILLVCLLLSGWYAFFPVRPSHVALTRTQYDTVGLMHRLAKSVIDIPILETIVLWGVFWCGLVLLTNIISYDIRRLRQGIWDYGHFLTIAVLCFLLIMPFSYHVWEKYLVIILPFILLRLMLMKYSPDYAG